jgi:hypothetical protein
MLKNSIQEIINYYYIYYGNEFMPKCDIPTITKFAKQMIKDKVRMKYLC